MNKQVYDWMKQWSDLVNKTNKNTDDFWIETPIGNFKNPKFTTNENDKVDEITITIKFDQWNKNQTDE